MTQGACVLLRTGSEMHLGVVQAVARWHLPSGNVDWNTPGSKVGRGFSSAGLQCSCSSPEQASKGNTWHFCLVEGCSATIPAFLHFFLCGAVHRWWMRYQMKMGTLLTLAEGKVSACFSRSFAASALLGQSKVRLIPL